MSDEDANWFQASTFGVTSVFRGPINVAPLFLVTY